MSVPGCVDGNAVGTVIARADSTAATEIGGVEESRACGIELCDKAIDLRRRASARGPRGLKRSRRGRKIARRCEAGYVRVARGVHGDAKTLVSGTATKPARIHESRARGIELRDKDAAGTANSTSTDRTRGCREVVEWCGESYDVRIAASVHRDGVCPVRNVAKVGRINERRAIWIELRHERVVG